MAIAISGHQHHDAAAAWFEAVRSPDTFHFCRQTQQSFLRLMSTAAFHAQFDEAPLTNERAWSAYDQLIADPRVLLRLEEPDGTARYWREYSTRRTSSPKVWMDAYLAAFARAGGYRFVTTDAAFRQYAGLDLLLLTDA